MVGDFGVSPSEYWNMTPAEVGLIFDSKRPKHTGGIHEDDIADMINRRAELEAQGLKVL